MRSKFRAKYINDTLFIENLVTWRHYNLILENNDICRITAILKVETDIIASIAETSRGLAVMLVIIYVVIFITGVIVFIGDIEMWLTSHLPIMFNISQFLPMRITNDLIFLWIKVSSVVQTLWEAHKGKISNWQIICYNLFYYTETTQKMLKIWLL
jgi:hypothetical protein